MMRGKGQDERKGEENEAEANVGKGVLRGSDKGKEGEKKGYPPKMCGRGE
jgi:hypothetical protein